jgi:hypothetical protein
MNLHFVASIGSLAAWLTRTALEVFKSSRCPCVTMGFDRFEYVLIGLTIYLKTWNRFSYYIQEREALCFGNFSVMLLILILRTNHAHDIHEVMWWPWCELLASCSNMSIWAIWIDGNVSWTLLASLMEEYFGDFHASITGTRIFNWLKLGSSFILKYDQCSMAD